MNTLAATGTSGIGELLRDWRQRRRLSQFDLALEASVSARHISFVETGRAKPSRELVLHLAEQLEVPLRERNALLLAAGYAPVYNETPLDSPSLAAVRDALERLLASHEPFPGVIVDRHWELIAANQPALALLADGVDPALLEPPANTLRISLHPDGLASRIVNFADYSAHLLTRLRRDATLSADPGLATLYRELCAYPGVDDGSSYGAHEDPLPFVPLRLRAEERELTFFSTIATFGTALDVTLAELAIESFYPGDAATAAALKG